MPPLNDPLNDSHTFINLHPISSSVTRFSGNIVWKPTETLVPPPDLGSLCVGDTVQINTTGSGLSDTPVKFYVRQASVDLWKHLSAQKTPVSFIAGSPGIGKSLEVYAYAMREASVHGKRVIYVHFTWDLYINIVAADGNGVRLSRTRKQKMKDPWSVVWSFIESALKKKSVDLIVLDGQLSDLIKDVFQYLEYYPGARLISCTSFKAVSLNSEQMDHCPDYEDYTVDSWTKEEQQSAVDMKALVLDPSVSSVDEAHYYAGGSARMIQWPVEGMIRCLSGAISQMDKKSLSALVGVKGPYLYSEDARNELISFIGGISTVTSRFVMGRLYSASEVAPLLPSCLDTSWDGKEAELEFLSVVESQPRILFRDKNGSIEIWPRWSGNRPMQEFTDADDPCFLDPATDWYKPALFANDSVHAIYRVRLVYRIFRKGVVPSCSPLLSPLRLSPRTLPAPSASFKSRSHSPTAASSSTWPTTCVR